MRRRRPRSDAAVRWWASLEMLQRAPSRPSRPLAATLALAATLLTAAMPLVWHHLILPNPAFYGPPTLEVLHGSDADSWMVVVGAIAAGLAVRLFARPPGPGVKVALAVLAFASVNGMIIDYLDWSRRGVSLQVPAFFGPGFYVGLGGAAVLVVAAVIAWRARE